MMHANCAFTLLKKLDRSLPGKLLGTVLVASVLTTSCSKPEAEAGAPPPVPVKVQALNTETVQDSSEFVGSLEAAEKVTLQPQIEGRIERVFVANGNRVQSGTPLIALSVDQTQANVSQAQAQVNSQRAGLATAQADLQRSQADQTSAQSNLKLAQIDYQRALDLQAEGAYSQQQLDTARNTLESRQAALDAATRQVAADQAAVNQAEAEIREAQAGVASQSVNLRFKEITSPINGVVGDIPIRVGDYVTPSTTLTTITQNDSLDMRISVPSNRSGQLRQGLAVELLDPTSNQSLAKGTIYFISPRVDTSVQSILVKARFPNREGRLRDGQYVKARVIWATKPGVLIPTSAISRIGEASFVFVTEQETAPDGKPQEVVRQRQVKLGPIQGSSYQVLEGLKPGDSVAVSNILKLRDGAPIQPSS